MTTFSLVDAKQVMQSALPSFLRDLGVDVIAIENGVATLRMASSAQACREGGIVSGQALAALADSAMAFAVWSARGGHKPIATVDLHTTFLRPINSGDAVATAEVIRLGRTLAFAQVKIQSQQSTKVAVTAVGTFALVE